MRSRILGITLLVAGGAWLLVSLPVAHRGIGAALVLIIAIAGIAAAAMIGRGRLAPLDEIGFWYVGLLAVYAVLPLAGTLALGLQYTLFNDLRLFELQPSASEVERVAWLYVLYIGVFAGIYLALRPRGLVPAGGVRPMRRATVLLAGTAWLLIESLLFVLAVRLDVSAASYIDQYRVMQGLPLIARQLFKLMFGLRFVVLLLLLLWVLTRLRYGPWLALFWVALQTWLTAVEGGGRTQLMVTVAAVLILYHRLVKPVTVRTAALVGGAGVVLFLALGLVRDVQNLSESGGVLGVRTNEFESIFANAVDIQSRKARGELAGAGTVVAFSDVLAVVPSQLAPFQKDDVSDWYLRTFYPEVKERGGGLAFGVIAQAIVNWGWIEVVLRAALVALAFALTHRFYHAYAGHPWTVVLNCWAIVWAYESFRASTFYMLHIFVQQFLAAFIILEVGRVVLEGAAAAQRFTARRPEAAHPA